MTISVPDARTLARRLFSSIFSRSVRITTEWIDLFHISDLFLYMKICFVCLDSHSWTCLTCKQICVLRRISVLPLHPCCRPSLSMSHALVFVVHLVRTALCRPPLSSFLPSIMYAIFAHCTHRYFSVVVFFKFLKWYIQYAYSVTGSVNEYQIPTVAFSAKHLFPCTDVVCAPLLFYLPIVICLHTVHLHIIKTNLSNVFTSIPFFFFFFVRE